MYMWLDLSKAVHAGVSVLLAFGITACAAGGWWRRTKNPEVSKLLWTTGAFCCTCMVYVISRANQTLTWVDAGIGVSVCALLALFADDVRSNSDK